MQTYASLFKLFTLQMWLSKAKGMKLPGYELISHVLSFNHTRLYLLKSFLFLTNEDRECYLWAIYY